MIVPTLTSPYGILNRKCPEEFGTRINATVKQDTDFDDFTDEDLAKIVKVSDLALSTKN